MEKLETLAVLLGLFYLLGKSADLIIVNIRKLSLRLGIGVFFLGLILGFLTSLPEMAIGLNAIASGIPAVSLGNLLGGIVVLLGLILGASVVMNRTIATDGRFGSMFLIAGFLLLPLILAYNGVLTPLEGGILILSYFILINYLFRQNRSLTDEQTAEPRVGEAQLLRQMFYIVAGVILIVLFSNAIIRLTSVLLVQLQISEFAIGLLLFALGTNLPEIVVAFRSYQRHIKELALSNIIGSAMANILLIGLFSILGDMRFSVGPSYFLLSGALVTLLMMFLIFYRTDKKFGKKEGFALIAVFSVYFLAEVVYQLVK